MIDCCVEFYLPHYGCLIYVSTDNIYLFFISVVLCLRMIWYLPSHNETNDMIDTKFR